MKVVVGFLSGLVIGAVGAVAYSVQTGRDLREVFEEVRSEISKGDLDALGARVESAVAEMQVQLDTRIAQVRDLTASVSGDAGDVAGDLAAAADDAAGTVADAADDAVGAVQPEEPAGA